MAATILNAQALRDYMRDVTDETGAACRQVSAGAVMQLEEILRAYARELVRVNHTRRRIVSDYLPLLPVESTPEEKPWTTK